MKATDKWNAALDPGDGLRWSIRMDMDAWLRAPGRPIRSSVTSEEEVVRALDRESAYVKTPAVLLMFEHWEGPEAFRRGLHDYLVAHRNGVATADDFLGAESAAAQRDVKTPFHNFIDHAGFPIITERYPCDTRSAPW